MLILQYYYCNNTFFPTDALKEPIEIDVGECHAEYEDSQVRKFTI